MSQEHKESGYIPLSINTTESPSAGRKKSACWSFLLPEIVSLQDLLTRCAMRRSSGGNSYNIISRSSPMSRTRCAVLEGDGGVIVASSMLSMCIDVFLEVVLGAWKPSRIALVGIRLHDANSVVNNVEFATFSFWNLGNHINQFLIPCHFNRA